MTALTLEDGKLYRNAAGKVALIVATVDPNSKAYRRGYRFVDQAGVLYSAEGYTKQALLFSTPDLVSETTLEDVTPDEYISMYHQTTDFINRWIKDHRKGIIISYKVLRIAGFALGGSNLTIGYLLLIAGRSSGWLNILIGAGSIWYWAKEPDSIESMI